MRTTRQKLFDDLYFGFEYWWSGLFNNLATRQAIRGRKFGPEFDREFKNTVLPYWAQFGLKPKKYWFKYLNMLTGSMDPRYIPHTLFMSKIVPHFDTPHYVRQLADKNLHSILFPTVKRPETVFKRIKNSFMNDDFSYITRQEAYDRLKQEGAYVIKPTRDSGQGTDVRFFHAKESDAEIEKLLAPYQETDYIVQKAVVQHPMLSDFNESSLNTVRIVTLVFQDKPYILSTILRIGAAGSKVDNVSKGGYQCTIQPDGRLEKLAYTDRSGQGVLVEENDKGMRWEDYVIPSFEKIRATAMDLAVKLPHLKLIGWDFAIDPDGDPVLIEFNSQISQNQATCGPTFGELTESVLAEVFGRKN